jgi:hypothetical protein
MSAVGVEVWLAAGYGLFLLMVAYGLDRLASRKAARSTREGAGGRAVEPWPDSEATRLMRGIACTIALLGALWPLTTMLEARTRAERVVLSVTTLLVGAGSWPLWSRLRHSPASFPEGDGDAHD